MVRNGTFLLNEKYFYVRILRPNTIFFVVEKKTLCRTKHSDGYNLSRVDYLLSQNKAYAKLYVWTFSRIWEPRDLRQFISRKDYSRDDIFLVPTYRSTM